MKNFSVRRGIICNYDAVGRMTSEYDLTWMGTPPNYTITWTGNTITYQYDAAGRLTKKTLPNGRYIAYTYDAAGRRTQMTDYFGGQTNYSYDALGRLTSLSNPYLYIVELGYYGDGDAGMYLLTQRWYNPLIGRFVVRDPLKPLNQVNFFNYVRDNPIEYTDPSGMICIPYSVRHHTKFHGTVCRQWELVTAYTVEGGEPPFGGGAATICVWRVTEESHGKYEKWWTIKYKCYDQCHKYWYTLTRETKHHYQTVDEKGAWTIMKRIPPVVSTQEELWCIVYGPPGPPSGCFYSP